MGSSTNEGISTETAKAKDTMVAGSEINTEEKSGPKKKETNLKSLGEYNREVMKELPRETFKREPMRLKYYVMYYAIIFACGAVITQTATPFIVKLLLSMLMGLSLGGTTFLGHEVLHGAIVKSRKAQQFLDL